jgi:AraC-like DNA-binding protein
MTTTALTTIVRSPDGARATLVTGDLPGVRAIRFDGSTTAFSYYNEVYAIATLFCAEGDVVFRGRTYATTSGVVGLMEPDGIFRRGSPPRPESVNAIHIEPSRMEEAARELDVPSGRVQFRGVVSSSPRLFSSLADFSGCLWRKHTSLEVQSGFAACLRLIIQERVGGLLPTADDGAHRSAQIVRDVLHARFAERVGLTDLAKAAGVSVFHLPRIFSRAFGVPPHAYQIHLRLAHARLLLGQGMAASQVAAEVGFTDQSHLSRHFQRTIGLTPRAFSNRTLDSAAGPPRGIRLSLSGRRWR